jgi:hypothetical protein
VLGSLSGTTGVDPAHSQPDSKGLGKARLEQADVTQRMKKWDLSLGRLTEPMGVTGYWFGREYDGIRGVYTGKTAQLRIGFGTFKQSTGVSDTAYTHVTYTDFYRPPTAAELMGILREGLMYGIQDEDVAALTKEYEENYKGKTDNAFFYQQIKEAYDNSASIEEKTAIIKRLHGIVKAAYGNELANKVIAFDAPSGTQVLYEVEDAHGNVKVKKTDVYYSSYISDYDSDEEKAFKKRMNQKFGFNAASDEALRADNSYLQNHKNDLMSALNEIAEYNAKQAWGEYGTADPLDTVWTLSGSGDTMTGTSTYDSSSAGDYRFKRVRAVVTEDSSGWPNYTFTVPDTMGSLYQDQYENESSRSRYGLNMSNILFNYLEALEDVLRESESENKLPRTALGNVVGNLIKSRGTVLEKDYIPPIDKALFVQYRKQLRPDLGVTAWYLRSIGDKNYTMQIANGTDNDSHRFSNLANVLGLGAQWQVGRKTTVSLDYGRNFTDFGKYMNGETKFDHPVRTDIFTPKGREMGSAPAFWTLRLDIGHADTDIAGTWNAFIDWKHFEHGSFFGGNGTGYLPDRYLDGIQSFTIGGGYVPAQNWLVELFYTFDAKGTNRRDTIHGSEKFKLGNYTRFQLTYKF